MTKEAADALLKEMAALTRRWNVPDHITPETLAQRDAELWSLRDKLKASPTAMTPYELLSLSAEMNWLRWATSTTKS